MAFDWPGFLRQHRVEYVTSGPNVGRGQIGVKCPWCGSADPSQHLVISLRGQGWSCRRNQVHSGKSRARLIQFLLRCSEAQARQLAYGEDSAVLVEDEDVAGRLRDLLMPGADGPAEPLSLPAEFKPLTASSSLAEPFRAYLWQRGYNVGQVSRLITNYKLHYATRGRFAYRIIMPIYSRTGVLMTWTGRSIVEDEELRYRTLTMRRDDSLADGGPYARCSIKSLLFGLPLLWHAPNPRALIICEGPFDAMRITAFGASLGVYGTCLFGLSVSGAQVRLIDELAERYPLTGLMVDKAAGLQGLALASHSASIQLLQIPPGVKDPGELSPQAVVALCWKVLELA